MTARQGKRDSGKTTSEQNQWFETLAIATIERLPTTAWENAVALWRGLAPSSARRLPSLRGTEVEPFGAVWPSTRDRILRRMLAVAARRGEPWSAKLVKRSAAAAIPVFANTKARNRVQDAEGLQRAARHVAHYPKASWSEIAKAAGVSRDTVRHWRSRSDFEKYVKDEEFQIWLGLLSRYSIAVARLTHQGERLRAALRRAK